MKVLLQAQHPGSWGPWYHESWYEVTTRKTLRYLSEGARLGHGNSDYMTPAEFRKKISGLTYDEIIVVTTKYMGIITA